MAVLVSASAGNLTTAGRFYTTISSDLGGGTTGYSSAMDATTYIVRPMTFSGSANLKGFGMVLYVSRMQPAFTAAGIEICLDQIMSPAITFTSASPCVATLTGHGFSAGQAFRITTTGALYTGLTKDNTIYYAGNIVGDTFNIYDTYANAIAGGATGRVNTSGSQSGTHTCKAIRLRSLNASSAICEGTAPGSQWVNCFEFGTADVPATTYAVDTTAGKWEIIIRENGAATANCHWQWCGHNTNTVAEMFHVAYTDTTTTYTDNTDQIVCKNQITVTAAATFKGALQGSTTDYAVAGWLCRSSDYSQESTRAMLVFDQGAAGYTATFDGSFVTSAHSGMRIGQSATPIPLTKQIWLKGKRVQTAGTAAGWMIPPSGTYNQYGCPKWSFESYGDTTTANLWVWSRVTVQANSGQKDVTVADATGFSANDYVTVANSVYEINSVAGNVITLKTNLSETQLVGAFVIRRHNSSGAHYYPIVLSRDDVTTTAGLQARVTFGNGMSWIDVRGTEFYGCSFETSTNTAPMVAVDDARYMCQTNHFYYVMNQWGTSESSWSTSGFNARLHHATSPLRNGLNFTYLVSPGGNDGLIGSPRMGDQSTWNNIPALGGEIKVTDWVAYACIDNWNSSTNFPKMTLNRVYLSRGGGSGNGFIFGGVGSSISNSHFWYTGSSGTPQAWKVCQGGWINGVNTDNTYTGLTRAADLTFPVVNCKEVNPTFTSCTNDYRVNAAYIDFEVNSPNSTLNPELTAQAAMFNGSKFKVTDDNNVSNADYVIEAEGKLVRTGYGLGDTTVRTSGNTFGAASSGKYALRMDSNNVGTLTFSQDIPTGDLTGKTMSVSVWAKINAAAYYAGTYTLPTLRVNYDNGTTKTAVMTADTNGQLLSVSFSPTTSYGQITVTLECKTDATGTNNRVYFDDFAIAYPPGVNLDLGAMDLWVKAEPVKPTIATVQSNANTFWDELLTSHTVSGSFGSFIKGLLTVAKWFGLK